MKKQFRKLILIGINVIYNQLNKRVIFKLSAQRAHENTITALRFLEKFPITVRLASLLHRLVFVENPTEIGGITLSHPLILAAGFVKGSGFKDEADALNAIYQNKQNIIPGWRIIPALVGPVEFGSFTRHPRLGNAGTVVWRNIDSQSTQNRVGLKNPGALAASKFLGGNKKNLPKEFGINIAVSPGVSEVAQQQQELLEALHFFIDEGVIPTWFTLNISCPNTEDDPHGNQLESETKQLCNGFINHLKSHNIDVPLWVKISPDLARGQYHMLIRIFDEIGVKAIVATNTLAQPTPDDPNIQAGVGGGELFEEAIMAVTHLRLEKIRMNYNVDLVGCGGIVNGLTYRDYRTLGIKAIQYWSAMVYRGPLAAAIIESELPNHDIEFDPVYSESLTQH
jgi:dihydroorotate dehydrogenase